MGVKFRLDGRRISPGQFGRELRRTLERDMERAVEDHAKKLARQARCPRHGKSGRVIRRGGKLYIESCCEEALSQLGR